MKYIKFFSEINNSDINLVGGKNASLGEMYQNLSHLGVKVPNGFAITSKAYWYLLENANLTDKIKNLLDIDITNIDLFKENSKKIRELIINAPFPNDLRDEIIKAYKILESEYGDNMEVAIRSSATAEDLPTASFAGQQDSYLNIKEDNLIEFVTKCFASLFNERAISYRSSRGFEHFKVALSVGVQKMVRSDKASSGVAFSIDTESGFKNVIFITSAFGLGENIVGGKIDPDEFYVFKPTLKKYKPIIKRKLGNKDKKMVYKEGGLTYNIATTKEELESFSISDSELLELAKYIYEIEKHYSKEKYMPMDIEWAKDGDSGEIFIVQARPETVQSQKMNEDLKLENYILIDKDAKVLTKGHAVGNKIGVGVVRVIDSLDEEDKFKEGEILVADNTDPDWEPIMKRASGVITNRGGRTCHAAIVAREIGVPTVVGCINATKVLSDGDIVTISSAEGEIGFVYEGELNYRVEKIDVSKLSRPKTKLYMNVGNPEKAFELSKIPNDGIGLARMEFIINNYIKAHPLALLDLYRGKAIKNEKEIREVIKGYVNPKEFFIKKLAEGVGMIASAFYPNPVIVRTSDFKTNEYKKLLGGEAYEPEEENPMIGYRGASRYYSKEYQEAFELECIALKSLRDEMGLTNIKVMIPFVRTVEEGKRVIELMAQNGLVQGQNGLEIYAMCEIPSNVILADEFLKYFDGFSIGSNDLTQLTLGVDRGSTLVSHIFDERNEAIKKMLQMVIKTSKELNKYIGICGQAPSDYPEFAEFLVKEGIDSISLNPDSILSVWQSILNIEGGEIEG